MQGESGKTLVAYERGKGLSCSGKTFLPNMDSILLHFSNINIRHLGVSTS